MYNRRRETVATAITNLDIHDIARAARVYGLAGVLIANPLDRQQWLLERILRHWKEGHGAKAHPNRWVALDLVHPVHTVEQALEWVRSRCGAAPRTIATSAKPWPQAVGYSELRQEMMRQDVPFIILLGTGWGLSDEIIQGTDYVLHPIMRSASYNHLSVRAATAVILDRLLGDRE